MSADDRRFLAGKRKEAREARAPRKHDEADFGRALSDALTAAGALVGRNNGGVATWKNGSRTRYGLGVGSGDLVVCYRGHYVEIETKARTKQSPQQVARERVVTSCGGLYLLARAHVDTVQGVVGRMLAWAARGAP